MCIPNTCNPQPRRIPMLGTEDPMPCKRDRAFTVQAEQGIWDIGVPAKTTPSNPLQVTKFRSFYTEDKLPFYVDHTGSVSDHRLIWREEIETCDVDVLLPLIVVGLTEVDPPYSTIAKLAARDIIRHVPADRILCALPHFIYACKAALKLSK